MPNKQWCDQHWAPYREGTANGVFAAIALMQAFIDSPMVQELADRSPAALNKLMEDGDKPVCCRLGDEVMGKILKDATAIKRRDDGTEGR